MRRLVIAVIGALSLNGAWSASARTDWQDCAGDPPADGERRVAACTALIDSQGRSREEIAVAYANRGNIYHLRGETDRAIQDYDKAIEFDPKYAIAHNNRGNAYSDKGNRDRAIADYSRAIELDHDFVEAYNNRGAVYLAERDYDRAIVDFDAALRIWNKYVPALVNRGLAYLKKSEIKRAIDDFDRALRIKPDHANALRYGCWARALANTKLEIALDYCTRSLVLKQQEATLANRGFVFFRMGRYRDAISDFDAVLALKPKFVSALYLRGVCKDRLGDAGGGNVDIAAANAIDSDVVAEFIQYGAVP